MDAQRHEILRRLNAFDAGPTETTAGPNAAPRSGGPYKPNGISSGDGFRPGSPGACRAGRSYPSSANFGELPFHELR